MGLEIRLISPTSSEAAQITSMLKTHQIDTILDVGANTGQFGEMLRSAGYNGRIISFEPLSTARTILSANSRKDPNWIIAPQAAIGAQDGEIELNIAGNSASSSVLSMLDTHTTAAPQSAYVNKEKVPLRTLDTLAAKYIRPDSTLFIKVDTQGYEDRVISGAPLIMSRAVGIQLEVSLVPLYEGQMLYDDIMRIVLGMGFKLWSITPVFVDPVSARLMQVDMTFFREKE